MPSLPLRLLTPAILMGLAACGQSPAPQDRDALAPAAASLTYYDDRAAFNQLFPGLPTEDFEEGNLNGFPGVGLPAPLTSESNYVFAPGEIEPGVSFSTLGEYSGEHHALSLIGQGFFGNSSQYLMAGYGDDSFVIEFTVDDVTAVGMDLMSFGDRDPSPMTVHIHGEDGLLESKQASGSASGVFFGLYSDEPIKKIVLTSTTANPYEGVDNLSFGTGKLPVTTASYTLDFTTAPTNRVLWSVAVGKGISGPASGPTISRTASVVQVYTQRTGLIGNTARVAGTSRGLVIGKNSTSAQPYAKGGQMDVEFGSFAPAGAAVETLKVSGVTTRGGSVVLWRDNTKVKSLPVPVTGANGSATLNFGGLSAKRIKVRLTGPGAVDDVVIEVSRP